MANEHGGTEDFFSLFFPWIICVNGGGRKNDIKIR
jgi:hypothetical protein